MTSLRVSSLRFSWTLPLLALLVLGTAGCDDDNPVSPSATEHADLEGVVVQLADGTELLRQWEGTITGSLEVGAGSTLGEVQIWFLDAEGHLMRPGDDHDHAARAGAADEGHDDHDHDHGDEIYSLGISVANTDVVQVVPHDGADWAVDMTGVQTGSTTVQFMVMHDGHADFTSIALPVTVTP